MSGWPNNVRPLHGGGNGGGRSRLAPFQIIEPASWQDKPIPARRWVVDGLIPQPSVSLITGDGGVGKSLLMMQLLTAAATGQHWLGFDTMNCRAFGLLCEDDPDEMQRRQHDINRHYGVEMGDLADLTYVSRVGEDNILMDFDRRRDEGRPTPLWAQIENHVVSTGSQLVVIDTLADTFGGNENIRTHVQQFVTMLRQLARKIDGAVILAAHPSLPGMTTGTGTSGSTAWHNTVRGRLYLTRPKKEGEDQIEDRKARVLKSMKSNYGEDGQGFQLRWENGVFIREGGRGGPSNVVDKIAIDSLVERVVTRMCEEGSRLAADRTANNYIVAQLLKHPMMVGRARVDIEGAKDRLLTSGRLVMVTIKVDRKERKVIRPAAMRLAEEDTE